MIKKILLAIVLSLSFSAMAQTAPNVEEEILSVGYDNAAFANENILNNWFISVGAGAQLLSSEYEDEAEENPINPSLGQAAGKWLSPGIGVQTMYSGLFLKDQSSENLCALNHLREFDKGIYGVKTNQMNLFADVISYASYLTVGYNTKRIWNIIPDGNIKWNKFL